MLELSARFDYRWGLSAAAGFRLQDGVNRIDETTAIRGARGFFVELSAGLSVTSTRGNAATGAGSGRDRHNRR
jgi:hypothetical protein